jgi:hypothetical protein
MSDSCETDIMKARLVVMACLLLALPPPLGFAQARTPEADVMAFARLLQEEACPTLRQYQKFIGEGTESELRMELAACAEKGFSPTPDDVRCVEYTRRRAALADEVPSFYLRWLKSHFPAKGSVAITHVKEVKRPNELEYQLITARVGTVEVVFFRQLRSTGPFGRIDLVSIGDEPVARLFAQEMKRHSGHLGAKP